jgi:hypothetical protein
LSKLIEIVTPNEDDPELYDGYQLDVNQLNEINQLIKNTIQINPNESYYLVSAGIYNW